MIEQIIIDDLLTIADLIEIGAKRSKFLAGALIEITETNEVKACALGCSLIGKQPKNIHTIAVFQDKIVMRFLDISPKTLELSVSLISYKGSITVKSLGSIITLLNDSYHMRRSQHAVLLRRLSTALKSSPDNTIEVYADMRRDMAIESTL